MNIAMHQGISDWVRWATVSANALFLLLMLGLLTTSQNWRVLLVVAIGCLLGSVHRQLAAR